MKIVQVTDTTKVVNLFQGWQETLIWSCLQRLVSQLGCPE